jgi:cell wall assembly regulator SMI1
MHVHLRPLKVLVAGGISAIMAATLAGLPALARSAPDAASAAGAPLATLPSGDLTVEVEGRVEITEAIVEPGEAEPEPRVVVITDEGAPLLVEDPELKAELIAEPAARVSAEVAVPASEARALTVAEQNDLAQQAASGAIDGATEPAQALLEVAIEDDAVQVEAIQVLQAEADPLEAAPATIVHNFWVVIAEPMTTGPQTAVVASATQRRQVELLLENAAAKYMGDTGWDWDFRIAPGTNVLRIAMESLCVFPTGATDPTLRKAAGLFAEAKAYSSSSPESYFNTSQAGRHLLVISATDNYQCEVASGYGSGGWAPYSGSPNPQAGGQITLIDKSGYFGSNFLTSFNSHSIIHELGHNLGLAHSGLSACAPGTGVSQDAWDEDGLVSCGWYAYDDPYDFMGNLEKNISPNQTYKWGLLPSSNYVEVQPGASNQRITLYDKQDSVGPVKLAVIRSQGGSETFFVEHRSVGDGLSGLYVIGNLNPTGYKDNQIKVPYKSYYAGTYTLQEGQTYTFGGVRIYVEATATNSTILVSVPTSYLEISGSMGLKADTWYGQSGGTMTRTIYTSATNWTASAAAGSSWLSLNRTSGTSGTSLSLTAQANTTQHARIGLVNVTAAGVTKPIYFFQLGVDDCGGTSATTCTWTLNPTGTTDITKGIQDGDDEDRIKFTAPATGTWTFEPAGLLFGSWVRFEVLNSSGVALAGTYLFNSGNTNASKYQVNLTQGQTYYLRLWAVSGSDFRIPLPADPYTIRASAPLQPVSVPTPTITGTKTVSYTLTAVVGATTPSNATKTFQWYRGTTAIPGATGSQYALVSADANQQIKVRVTGQASGYADASADSAAYTITPATVSVSPTVLSLGQAAGSTGSIVITTNQFGWSATSDQTWLTVGEPPGGVSGASLTIRAASANTGTSARTATVTVRAFGGSSWITTATTYLTVTQAGLSCTNPISSFAVSGTKTVGYTLTAAVVTNPTTATKAYQWYRGSTAIPGATSSQYTLVAADANQQVWVRVTVQVSGCAAYTADSSKYTIAPATLSVSVSSLSFDHRSNQQGTTVVTTNQTGWTASSSQTWLTVSPASGSSGATLRLTAATVNTSSSSRTATVTVRAGAATPVTVTVTQAPYPSLVVSPTSVSVGQAANSVSGTITVTTNQPSWTPTSSTAWLTVKPSGNTFTVTAAAANNSTSSRQGTVVVSAGLATSVTVYVTQAGLTDDCGSSTSSYCTWTLSSTGASTITKRLEVASDIDWIRFTPPSSGMWTFTSSGIPSGSDIYGSLLGATGAVVTSDDNSGGSNNFKISVKLTAGTNYYLKIQNFSSTATVTANPYTITAAPPVIVPVPTISGTKIAGYQLTASVGTTTPSNATKTYQWYRGTTAIPGATASQYTLVSADGGQQVWVRVTGSASGFTTYYTDSAKYVISGAALSVSGTSVTVSSSANSTGSVVVTTNQPSWVAVSNQAWLTVSPTTGVSGATLTLRATSANTGSAARTATVTLRAGTATTYVTVTQPRQSPVALSTPTITGTKIAGYQLTASVGTTTPSNATKTYQWFRGSGTTAIATGATYTLTAADAGQQVWVRVTGTASGYTTATADSAKYTIAAATLSASTVTVSLGSTTNAVSGTVTVTTNQSSWTATPNVSWFTVVKSGNTFTVKATQDNPYTATRSGTLTLRAGVATAVTVTVTQAALADDCGSNTASYCSWSLNSTSASTITKRLERASDIDWIRFTAPVGGTWTFTSSGVPSGAVLSGRPLNGQGTPQAHTYESTSNGNFKITISLTAGAVYVLQIQNSSSTTSVTANPYTITAAPPVIVPTPTITGTKIVGYQLAASIGTSTPSYATKAFQWYRGSTPISGATSTLYTLVAADANQQVWVRVTGTASGYTTATADSAKYTITAATLTVAKTSVLLGSANGSSSGSLAVTTNQTSFRPTANVSWLNVTWSTTWFSIAASSANTSTLSRTGTVTVNAGGATPVTITVTQSGQDECGQATYGYCAWTLSSSGSSTISKGLQTATDEDYIRFTAPVSGSWTFQSSNTPSGSDIYGHLLNASGTQLAYNDDGAGDRNFKITYTLTAGTVYYLRVRNYSTSTTVPANPYTITATRS